MKSFPTRKIRNFLKRAREHGISLRDTNILMFLLTILLSAAMLLECQRTYTAFLGFSKASEVYISLQKEVVSLMDASDYLTEEVQRFTVCCDPVNMENYFEEAVSRKRRDEALDHLRAADASVEAVVLMERAMNQSVALMQREYYAMRLVIEAEGITEYPDVLGTVKISKEDNALSPEQKIRRAQMLVHDASYEAEKESIRNSLDYCQSELELEIYSTETDAHTSMNQRLSRTRLFVIVQFLLTFAMILLTSYLGIFPLLRGVQKIKEHSTLPIRGSYEFRYLARTYNKMYEAFKKSIASLNYEASHDKLTGLYNRAGYDILCQSIDLPSTAVLLVDADYFKEINDTYGHAVGDRVLQKIAAVLRQTFRSEDYVCRIGGDEFVVFMLHVSEDLRGLIGAKTENINRMLARTDDDIPPVSTSIGIAFGSQADSVEMLVSHADEALYAVKKRGRKGCAFYQPH